MFFGRSGLLGTTIFVGLVDDGEGVAKWYPLMVSGGGLLTLLAEKIN